MIDLAKTVEAKVDQLTADELLGGPRTIQIERVTGNDDSDQPISIHFQGDGGKPFKPCKTVRRVLMHMWGRDGSQFVGRSLTLYRDDSVKFGGLTVGGVRISHASHIEREMVIPVTTTRGKKAPVKVRPLKAAVTPLKAVETDEDTTTDFEWSAFEAEVNAAIKNAIDPDALTAWWDGMKAQRLQARAADKVKAGDVATKVSAKISELTEALNEA